MIDGDTIVIPGNLRVRCIRIDAPEHDEPLYREATEANHRLVEGKTVRLEKDVSDTDRFGRLLRYVHAGDMFVIEELVRLGMAKAVPKGVGRGLWEKKYVK